MPTTEILLRVSLHPTFHNKSRIGEEHQWQPGALTLEQLLAHVSGGKAFVACQLSGATRNTESYLASNLVILDLDGDLDLAAFWQIPAVLQHCAATYTSCSHGSLEKQEQDGSPSSDRFRALFVFDEDFSSVEQHAAAYDWIVSRISFAPKDPSGRKPLQLWYGNDQAVVRTNPAAASPGWDVIEDIRDRAVAPPAAIAPLDPSDLGADDRLDVERAAWLLQHLLRPSSDGEYLSYWQPVFNYAAASQSDLIWSAFLDWHCRGHHVNQKNVRRVERDRSKAGTRTPVRQALGCLFRLAKEQDTDWKHKLPEHLRFGGGAQAPKPTSLMRSRPQLGGSVSFSAETAAAAAAGNNDPIAAEFQARRQLMSRQTAMAPVPDAAASGGGDAFIDVFNRCIERMYLLATRYIHLSDEGEQQLEEDEANAWLLHYREQLFQYQVLSREPQHIERRLMDRFRSDHGLEKRTKSALQVEKLFDGQEIEHVHLLPNLLAVGQSYLFYARQGVGKTLMALALARSVLAVPGHNQFLDFPPVPLTDYGKRRVLFIASDGGKAAKADLMGYAKAMGMKDTEWINRDLDVVAASPANAAEPWRMDLYQLHWLSEKLDAAAAEGRPYNLVIVDSLKACAPDGILVGQQVITDYLHLVDGICHPRCATVLYISHQSKEADHAQGAAGIAEMVHGVFRLKLEERQRIFCVDKTRLVMNGNREIPVNLQGDSVFVAQADEDGSDDGRFLLINALCQHYERFAKKVAHLGSKDPQRTYRGVAADSLYATCMELGIRHPSWTNARAVSDLAKDLCSQRELEKTGRGRSIFYRASGTPDFVAALNDQHALPGWD